MQPIALHTVLKPGAAAEYERVHATIPPDLDAALRAGGVLLAVDDDYSGADTGLRQVWELP